MKRFSAKIYKNDICIIPTFGIYIMWTGRYKYKYRITFAWLVFRFSIGISKIDKEEPEND